VCISAINPIIQFKLPSNIHTYKWEYVWNGKIRILPPGWWTQKCPPKHQKLQDLIHQKLTILILTAMETNNLINIWRRFIFQYCNCSFLIWHQLLMPVKIIHHLLITSRIRLLLEGGDGEAWEHSPKWCSFSLLPPLSQTKRVSLLPWLPFHFHFYFPFGPLSCTPGLKGLMRVGRNVRTWT
jgi:hypothetical protein